MQWVIADSLELTSKTCHRNFEPLQRRWLPRFGNPRDIIWMGTWGTFHAQQILLAPGVTTLKYKKKSLFDEKND